MDLSRKNKFIFLAVIVILIPFLMEIGARIIVAVRMGNPAYLHFPKNAPIALNLIVIKSNQKNRTAPHHLQPGASKIIANRRFLHEIPMNKSGFRGKDLHDPKTAKWRIVTMGGSSTLSLECPVGASYPEVLERVWNQQLGQGSVEVINRARHGMTVRSIAELFESDVVPASPDLVTVCSAYNSVGNPLVLDLRPGQSPVHRRLLWGRSLFYTALFNSRMADKDSMADQEVRKTSYQQDLEKMISVARKSGVKLLFIIQPICDPDRIRVERISDRIWGEDIDELLMEFRIRIPAHNELSDIMIKVAESNDIPYVDPRPALLATANPEDRFWICLHLTPEGSALMAQEIIRQINERYEGFQGIVTGGSPASS